MKSGLLRVLTKQSADLETELLPPVRLVPPVATTAAGEIGTTRVAAPPRQKRSRVIVGAAIVAGLVLAADATFLVLHAHKARVAPPPPPLPTYMVLPAASPPPPPEHVIVPAAPEIIVMPAEQPKPRTHGHHHRRR